MNKILLIEIKDTNALIILFKNTSNGWHVLLSKEYEYESDNTREIDKDNLASFDLSWIPKMKKDVSKIISINKINDIFLTINTIGTVIELKNYDIKTTEKTTETFSNLINKELHNDSKLSLINYKLEDKIETPLHKKLKISYEYVNKKIVEDIKKYLETFNIRITKIISSKDAIFEALKPYMNKSKKIINIQIEDKFTSFYYLRDEKLASFLKRNQGLNFIYRKIANQYKLTIDYARYLFLTFGNIPPEIIKDNRIIFNGRNLLGEKIIFSKKDLSKIITFAVNDILKDIINKVKDTNIKDYEIIFSGQITKLNGFEDYAKNRLDIKNVTIYKTNFIGINSTTEIIAIGSIYEIEKNIIKNIMRINLKQNQDFKLDNSFAKRKNIILMLKDKLRKYYNYI